MSDEGLLKRNQPCPCPCQVTGTAYLEENHIWSMPGEEYGFLQTSVSARSLGKRVGYAYAMGTVAFPAIALVPGAGAVPLNKGPSVDTYAA